MGFQDVTVTKISALGSGYSATWIIEYKGFYQSLPNATVNGASLVGGSTTPTIGRSILRDYSSDIFFNPIDYRFLNTDASSPNVMVTTNGVPSICTGNCGYTFAGYS